MGITLGAELRHLRQERGFVPSGGGWTYASSALEISRIESGLVRLKETDVLDLLSRYGVTDAKTIDGFRQLAREADRSGCGIDSRTIFPADCLRTPVLSSQRRR
jgi:hypothetical protein